MKNIQNKILEVINGTIDSILSENQLDEDLSQFGMDSLKFISTVVILEESFDIQVPDEYLLPTEMNTVRKIDKVVSEALAFKNNTLN